MYQLVILLIKLIHFYFQTKFIRATLEYAKIRPKNGYKITFHLEKLKYSF